MIHRSETSWQGSSWQQELQQLITAPEALFELVGLDRSALPAARAACKLFPLRATRAYVSRIKKGDANDPLLLQILPLGAELSSPPGYSKDPLNETEFNPIPGVVHKYASRLLLISSSQCAINCRYCFRREFPYQDNRPNKSQWTDALTYIRNHPELNEVILSGGDPLSSSDNQISWLHQELTKIAHIKRFRIHTRYPIVLPNRVTDTLLNILTSSRLKPIMVVHTNHPQELDACVTRGLKRIAAAGITLLNQSVLLRRINDEAATLARLSESLFEANALPYYLHVLDPVVGTAHFSVAELEATHIYRQLLAQLPGFLVPRLVKELANRPSKTLVTL